jgi:drug/metabolite transporter (DMT)-like permease
LLGNLINAAGLALAPQTVFAAVGGVTIVANAINSHFILGETMTPRVIVSSLLIIAGSTLAVVFASFQEEDFNLHDLERLFSRWFIIYAAVVALLIVSLFTFIHSLSKRLEALECGGAPLLQPLPPDYGSAGHRASVDSQPAAEDSIRLRLLGRRPSFGEGSNASATRRERFLLSMAIPAFAGLIGSITVLLAKSVSETVRVSVEGDNQFRYVSSYFLVVALFCCGATQIHWMNKGLQRYDQVVVVPTFFVVYTTFGILGGAFYFHETHSFTTRAYVMFPIGTLATFFGVVLTASEPERLDRRRILHDIEHLEPLPPQEPPHSAHF